MAHQRYTDNFFFIFFFAFSIIQREINVQNQVFSKDDFLTRTVKLHLFFKYIHVLKYVIE